MLFLARSSKGFPRLVTAGTELLPQIFLRVVQVGRHHVFKEDAEAGAGGGQGQPPAQRSGSDNCDGCQEAASFQP